MADVFDEREKSFEAKYKMDEELRFKVQARRNRLLGRWAAQRMGMGLAETEVYAIEVVRAGLEEAGVGDVGAKVLEDFRDRGLEVGEDEIRAQIERLHAVALEQVAGEYPHPLGPDHQRTGD